MSFPPRPGMPPMPPGMMAQGYGYPPMGMMPMGMRMMQPMMSGSNSSGQRSVKKLVPQEIPKEGDEKPPVTTVFVGNISDRAPDAMVRQMLQRCGNVLSWKRVQGASGKLQAFGFCEYEYPEATLRCIRLLNEWSIADKRLVVKVDAKTKTLLDDYKRGKKEKSNGAGEKDSDKEEGETDDKPIEVPDEELDEMTQREDRVAKAGLDAIMREYSEDLAKQPQSEIQEEMRKERRSLKEQQKREKEELRRKDEGLEDMGLDNDMKNVINREIRSFRDAHKMGDDEKEDPKKDAVRRELERERREREKERRERSRRLREREKEERVKPKSSYRSRTRSRSRERERERDRGTRERSLIRDRDRDRTNSPRDDSRERDDKTEDEEEIYERRKMERKVMEKENAYQERLKNWEARERKKSREYEKEKEKEEERKLEENREARRLKEFLEDYDDERDDPKYFKFSALQRRLKEREREMEADARDRQREREEIEEIRRKLVDEGHPDLEAEMAKIERERDEHLMPRLNATPSPPHHVHEPIVIEPSASPKTIMMDSSPAQAIRHYPIPEASASSQSSPDVEEDDYPQGHAMIHSEEGSNSNFGPPPKDDGQSRLGFGGLKLGASDSPVEPKKKKLTVGDVFNQDDDDEAAQSKKRKLVPLDYEEATKPTTAEEKRKCIKNLIERIPTAKNELFAYKLDWTMVDTVLMDRRIKPWVNKKIVEYIGEEEPTLTEFICQKVMANSQPQTILSDVAMVLDEEAEVFVVKMWRLLIYETEAKKQGLVK